MLKEGDWFAPRGMMTLEERDVTVFIRKPWLVPFDFVHREPHLSNKIMAYEIATLIGQTAADPVAPRQLLKFADRALMHGVYGLRIRGQLVNIIAQLESDRESRQAVLTIFDHTKDLYVQAKDVPCTLTVQFFVRNDMLHMRSSMRSNDAWLGLPYDLIQFCTLQCFIADCLGLTVGEYTHTVGSMHIYERDHDAACALINSPAEWMYVMDRQPLFAPVLLDVYEQGVYFCQKLLFGDPLEPQTAFETFLVKAFTS